MRKWIKRLTAVLLLPFCVGGVKTLLRVVAETGRSDLVWVPLLAGAACWLTVYLLLPKPMQLYVVGHELTHVIWTWLFGGRVRRFKASARGGHVVVTRTNFLITLAPYFFPFYAALVVLLFWGGHLLWGWTDYLAWFHLCVGAAYSFHLTLTWHILHRRQSDITSQGYLFSGVVIFLGNLAVLVLGLPLLSGQSGPWTALGWWLRESESVFIRLRDIAG